MSERPLCRQYHPARYAWHCAAGFHAPRDCLACTRYDVDKVSDDIEDQIRVKQWTKAHQLPRGQSHG